MSAPILRALSLAIAAALASVAPVPARAEAPAAAPKPAVRDGQRDFDWLFGKWTIKVRRLKRPLSGSKEWYTMTGTSVVRPIWGGKANIEEFTATGPDGPMEAIMVRLYSPASGQWSLNWANRKNGRFDVPTIGQFRNGRGEFFSDETLDGKPIRVRFIISDITPSSAHFEQAFSADGGKTWEVNWIATDTRLADR